MRKSIVVILIVSFILLPVYLFSENNPTEDIELKFWEEYQIPDFGEVLIDIAVVIPTGNHIYIDHLKKDSYSILSEFIIPDGAGVELNETMMPIGEVLGNDIILKGSRVFQLKLENKEKRADGEKTKIPVEFKVQMCNDDSDVCYIPYTFKKELNLVFLKKPKTKKTKSEGGIHWVYKHTDGLDEAGRLNKNMFVLITAPDWCGPCQYLEETTLRDSKVIDFINNNFVPIQIRDTVNGERNPELWTYDFEGYPTYLVATPKKELLYQDAGTISAPLLLTELEKFKIEVESNSGRLLTKDIIQKINCAVRFDSKRGLGILENGKYVIFNLDDKTMSNKYPLSISDAWKDLQPYQNKIISGLNYLNGKYYFFLKDNTYLRFSEASLSLDPGYPKKVDYKTWPGLDSFINELTASFIWPKNNKVYFFLKSGEYLRYDKKTTKIDEGYPKEINDISWPGLGTLSKHITSSYNDGKGFTYFILNTGEIVTYDDVKDKVVEGPSEEVIEGEIVTADDRTFYSLIENKLAFVDFYADWCGPCQEFAPVFKRVAEKLPDGLFIKIDVDVCPELCNDFNIEWIPYVVAINNGKVIEEAPWSEDAFIKWASDLIKKYK